MIDFNNENKLFSSEDLKILPEELRLKILSSFENLEQQNIELQNQIKKFRSDYLYSQAAYDNFRKETSINIIKISRESKIGAVFSLLPISDGLDEAIKICSDPNTAKGLEMFKKIFDKTFKQLGVTEIYETGVECDTNIHKVAETKSVEGKGQDEVLEVLMKGYKLDNVILRHALVIINSNAG